MTAEQTEKMFTRQEIETAGRAAIESIGKLGEQVTINVRDSEPGTMRQEEIEAINTHNVNGLQQRVFKAVDIALGGILNSRNPSHPASEVVKRLVDWHLADSIKPNANKSHKSAREKMIVIGQLTKALGLTQEFQKECRIRTQPDMHP